MKHFSMLIKPASSLCNMRCKYCFYDDVSSARDVKCYQVMGEETMNCLIDNVLSNFHEEVTISFAFQGGEPTCAKLSYFEAFVNRVNEKKKEYHTIHYSIQTNATLLNEKWVDFFQQHHFLVGVSLDGFMENHDQFRVELNQQGTYWKIMENIDLLKKAKVDFNILTVLTKQLAKKPKELFDFYLEHDFKYVQLIPCLPEVSQTENAYSCSPKDFQSFYDVFFQCWYEQWVKGNIMSVTFFDNLIPMFANIPPFQCGYLGFCNMQYVVESDGSVYPCDFYVLDEMKVGNIKENTLVELAKSAVVKKFIQEKRVCSKACQGCRYETICHGQCRRMSVCYYDDEYCGLKEWISNNEQKILEVASTIR